MRSGTNRSQLVLETEWHAISTVSFRSTDVSPRHVRAGLWISHVHGVGVNMVWVWGRDGWTGVPKGRDGFWGSLAMQPLAFDAFARGAVEMNAVAPFIEALASEPPEVYLFQSQESMGLDQESLEDTLAAYSLLHSMGVSVGWTSLSAGAPVPAGWRFRQRSG